MESFVFSENTDEYIALVWRQFYYTEKNRFFGERNRLKTIFSLTMPVLMFLAYWANGKASNLVVACFLSLLPLFSLLFHLMKKSDIKKFIADFSNSKPYTITITEDGIDYVTESSHTELRWNYFVDYEEFEGNFTLYRNQLRNETAYLPLSLVPNNEMLINLVRQKVKRREE